MLERYPQLKPDQLALLREIVARRCPVLMGRVRSLDISHLTSYDSEAIVDALGDELCESELQEDGELTPRGLAIEELIGLVFRPKHEVPETWLDRIIGSLYVWCGLATVLGIPGVIIVALVLPADTARLVARWVFVAAVLTLPMAVYLDVTYMLRNGGNHTDFGCMLAAPAYYVVFVIVGMSAPWWWRVVAGAGLVGFHLACHEHLAWPIARRLGARPPQYGEPEGDTGSGQ